MAGNRVMKLWTVIVTAFLALCTALGFVTAATAAAAPRTEEPCSSPAVQVAAQLLTPWSRLYAASLPPTMKQRIQAEAHGKSPGCRRRPVPDHEASAPSEHTAPLQT